MRMRMRAQPCRGESNDMSSSRQRRSDDEGEGQGVTTDLIIVLLKGRWG